MAKKSNDLVSFPMRLSHEVERLFDEMIHRPWGFCRELEPLGGPVRSLRGFCSRGGPTG